MDAHESLVLKVQIFHTSLCKQKSNTKISTEAEQVAKQLYEYDLGPEKNGRYDIRVFKLPPKNA